MSAGVSPHYRSRGGWVMTDAVTALAIVLILLSVLAVAISRQQRGSQRLADTRAAVRLAEDTITAMQHGATRPTPPEGTKVTVRPAATQPGMPAPNGCAWVDVEVTYATGRTTRLSGLVRRADAVATTAPVAAAPATTEGATR